MKYIIAIIILAYLILFWNFEASYKIKRIEYKLEYTSIVWVALDYWTIWRYGSTDKPKEVFKYTKTELP